MREALDVPSLRDDSLADSVGAVRRSTARPLVLLVEECAVSRALLVRSARGSADLLCAGGLEEGMELVRGHVVGGVITSFALRSHPEGGVVLARAVARRSPGVPVAMVVRQSDAATVNRVISLGATVLCQPFAARHLRPFLDRLTARATGFERLAAIVSAVAEEWELRPRERELLVFLLAGTDREQICARAGYGTATYKTHVNRLLARAGCARTSDLVVQLLRRSVGDAQPVSR